MTALAPRVGANAAAMGDSARERDIKIAALQANRNQYILDKNGNCVVIIGPDISMAPMGQYGVTPTMHNTFLSGPGIATFKTGTWVQVA